MGFFVRRLDSTKKEGLLQKGTGSIFQPSFLLNIMPGPNIIAAIFAIVQTEKQRFSILNSSI